MGDGEDVLKVDDAVGVEISLGDIDGELGERAWGWVARLDDKLENQLYFIAGDVSITTSAAGWGCARNKVGWVLGHHGLDPIAAVAQGIYQR